MAFRCFTLLLILSFVGLTLRAAPPNQLGPVPDPDSPAAAQSIARRAMAAMTRGDLAGAKKDFQRVLALVPGNIPTTINLGLIEYRQGNHSQAEDLVKKVTAAQPQNGLGWLILGVIYYNADKLDAALAALSQAVLYSPKDARAHHFLGVTVGKKGWYLGAEDEMRKAIALAPDYEEAHFDLAVFYLQRNPPGIELARRHYHKALDLGAARDPDVEKRLGE